MSENAETTGVPGVDGVDVFGRSYDWPPYPGSQGQCMDCGFLTRRSGNARMFAIEEVSIEQRKQGDLLNLKDSAGPSIPWCLVRPSSEVDLLRETEVFGIEERAAAQAAGTPDFVQVSIPEHLVSRALMVDRKCPEWWWYTPGLSPTEHRTERNVLRLETDRKAHAQQLADMQTRVQTDSLKIAEALRGIAEQTKDIAEQTKGIHEASTEASGRTDDFMRKWTLAAVLVGLVALLVVLATYLYPEGGREAARLLSLGWDQAWFYVTHLRR
jgi:hypothetical protein